MLPLSRPVIVLLLFVLAGGAPIGAADADEDALKKAVSLYASFDEAVKADHGGGDLTVFTGVRPNPDPGKPAPAAPTRGFDAKVFTIVQKGVAGGCLEPVGVLPGNGRILFPAKGNIAFKKGGWSGAASCWVNFDPNTMLKTTFCDPLQITQKGANNGGIWFDYNNAKPRDMRMGVFPAVPEGKPGIKEEDPAAPLVRIPKIGFKSGDWHHVVLNWKNFDTGKPDAHAELYIDGKKIGEVTDRAIAMDWDIDKAGIYFAINYIGLLDELALFNRALTVEEIGALHKKPGLLTPLKKAAAAPAGIGDLARRLAQPPAGQAPAAPPFPFAAAAARQYQQDYARWLGVPVQVTNAAGMNFVLIPPGTFRMGSPADEPGHNAGGYEETLHPVTLTRPFYLSTCEVTVAQFRQFVEAEKYVTDVEKKGGGHAHDAKAVWQHRTGTQWRKPGFAGPFELLDTHPIVHVSWTDSMAYCAWLNGRLTPEAKAARLIYRLPTEAQWEWACRAGSAERYWWGAKEDTTGRLLNCGDATLKKVQPDWPRVVMPMDDRHAFLAPVGSYQPNPFGLHDMLGNVWEFCADRYRVFPKEAVTDPVGSDEKRGYCVRGGGWSNTPTDCRSASRNADPPHFGHSNLGFRVALLLGK